MSDPDPSIPRRSPSFKLQPTERGVAVERIDPTRGRDLFLDLDVGEADELIWKLLRWRGLVPFEKINEPKDSEG